MKYKLALFFAVAALAAVSCAQNYLGLAPKQPQGLSVKARNSGDSDRHTVDTVEIVEMPSKPSPLDTKKISVVVYISKDNRGRSYDFSKNIFALSGTRKEHAIEFFLFPDYPLTKKLEEIEKGRTKLGEVGYMAAVYLVKTYTRTRLLIFSRAGVSITFEKDYSPDWKVVEPDTLTTTTRFANALATVTNYKPEPVVKL